MHSHSWNVAPREAIEIQKRLRIQVTLQDELGNVDYVAGVDVGFEDDGKGSQELPLQFWDSRN